MPKGKVIFFNKKSNFGFIRNSDGNESYYVKGKNLNVILEEGDVVEFELKAVKRGLEAVNVKKLRG